MTDHRTCHNCAYVGGTVGRPCYHPEVDESGFRFRPVNGILHGCWRAAQDLYEARMGILHSEPWPQDDEPLYFVLNTGTASNPAWIRMDEVADGAVAYSKRQDAVYVHPVPPKEFIIPIEESGGWWVNWPTLLNQAAEEMRMPDAD